MDKEPADLYAVLGVGHDAEAEEIEAAFHRWDARDDADGPSSHDQAWERAHYAYEVLSNPQRRETYDSLVVESAGSSLNLSLALSTEELPLLDSPHVLYALLTLQPRETESERRPLNLGLVVDRSTSMRGERLEKVTTAISLLLDKLGPDDRLSLVSFSDRAEVVLPAAILGSAANSANPDTASAWRAPHKQLKSIIASGGTEIFQGLRAGLAQMACPSSSGYTNHIILLTDGHTYGDAADCLRLAELAASRGISMTAFGLGADWNDAFLDALVAPSGGHSHYIEKPDDVLPHLEKRLQGLGVIHARNLTMSQSWPSQFTLRHGFKLTPFPQPLFIDNDPIRLGDLEGRSPMSVLLEFHVAPQSVAAGFHVPFEVRFAVANGDAERVACSARLTTGATYRTERNQPSARLIEAVRWFTLYRMQEKAWEEAQSGKPETAAARMKNLTTRYMETGDLRLARQAQLEAQQLTHLGAMSVEGHKMLKYGTRSLMGQTDDGPLP